MIYEIIIAQFFLYFSVEIIIGIITNYIPVHFFIDAWFEFTMILRFNWISWYWNYILKNLFNSTFTSSMCLIAFTDGHKWGED